MENWQERTQLLFGEEQILKIRSAHVLVIGAGGVGGYALEMLARIGVGEISIVDADTVQDSNRNRQLIATAESIGKAKVDEWRARIRAIAPNCVVHTHQCFVRDELTEELLDAASYSFVIDAIDTLSPKVHLIASLVKRGIPFISAMGAGSKFDPTCLRIQRMDKVRDCPLSRMVRKRLRRIGIKPKFPVVYSTELPDKSALVMSSGETNKKAINGTVAYLPAVAGCYAAYFAINCLVNGWDEQYGNLRTNDIS